MKNSKLKPKHTIKKSSKIILALAGLLGLLLAFTLIKDAYRHKRVVSAMNQTQSALKKNEFDNIIRDSGCGRTQAKYGKGAKICTIVLDTSVDFSQQSKTYENKIILEAVNKKVESFYKSIESTGLYERRAPFPIIHLPGEGFSSGSSIHRLKELTSTSCGSPVGFDWDTHKLDLSFYCRDTSWFDRLFRNGRYSF